MSNFNLKKWRQRLGFPHEVHAATRLGLSLNQYHAYENNEEEIPRYIELAAFAVELGDVLFHKAREQYPKFRHQGMGYGYTRSHFLKLFFEEKRLLYSLKLNKTDPLFLKGNKSSDISEIK